jgi:hypothetical protein
VNLLVQNISPRESETEVESSANPAPDLFVAASKEIEPGASPTQKEQSQTLQQELPLERADPLAPMLKIPPILLEGDETMAPPLEEASPKFAVGSIAVTTGLEAGGAVLPDAYGTERLWLAARDPHCLYARWDVTSKKQQNYCALAAGNRLVLRVYAEAAQDRVIIEVTVPSELRHCFIPIAAAGKRYVAELGYYQKDQRWTSIVVSESVSTPQEGVAQDKTVRFATAPSRSPIRQETLPPAPSLSTLEESEKGQTREHEKPCGPRSLPQTSTFSNTLRSPATSQASPRPTVPPEIAPGDLPEAESVPVPDWSAAQEEALAEIAEWSLAGLAAPSSAEMTQLLQPEAASSPPIGISSLPLQEEISSPFGGEFPQQKGFWFSLNAELVIYGATEPTARVTIGGRAIQLRPDGTFSYRFALPDGRYGLPIEAASAQGDLRQAELEFYRHTIYQGEVQAHPQSPHLKKPDAGNVPRG